MSQTSNLVSFATFVFFILPNVKRRLGESSLLKVPHSDLVFSLCVFEMQILTRWATFKCSNSIKSLETLTIRFWQHISLNILSLGFWSLTIYRCVQISNSLNASQFATFKWCVLCTVWKLSLCENIYDLQLQIIMLLGSIPRVV